MTERVFMADGGDPQMARAIEGARASFRYFWRELSWEYRRIVPAHDLIAVKAMFAQGAKVEHMWIGDVAFDGRVVSGRLLGDR